MFVCKRPLAESGGEDKSTGEVSVNGIIGRLRLALRGPRFSAPML
jgi:hypothetical protein